MIETDHADSLAERVLAALPEPTRTALEKLFREAPLEPATLSDRVRAYAAMIEGKVRHGDIVDHWTAALVERKCLALVEKLPAANDAERSVIQAAILYFVEQDDGEDDTRSPVGFDDDLEVVDAVATTLGFDDVSGMIGS